MTGDVVVALTRDECHLIGSFLYELPDLDPAVRWDTSRLAKKFLKRVMRKKWTTTPIDVRLPREAFVFVGRLVVLTLIGMSDEWWRGEARNGTVAFRLRLMLIGIRLAALGGARLVRIGRPRKISAEAARKAHDDERKLRTILARSHITPIEAAAEKLGVDRRTLQRAKARNDGFDTPSKIPSLATRLLLGI